MAETKVFRAFVSGDIDIGNVIVVKIDRLTEKTSHIAQFSQEVLRLWSTHDVGQDWPYEEELPLKQLLRGIAASLDGWEDHAWYAERVHEGRQLHALGLGSTSVARKRATLLALALCALLASEDTQLHEHWASFKEEVSTVRKLKAVKIQGSTVKAQKPCTAFSPESEGIRLPEAQLLRKWQGINVPWMPGSSAKPVHMRDLKQAQPISGQTFDEFLRRAKGAFLEESRARHLQPDAGRSFFDITESFRPWLCILAAHSEVEKMVGTGITSCKVVRDRRVQDALVEDTVVFFEVKQQNGSVFGFHSLRRSHQSLQEERLKEDERLAFQLVCRHVEMDLVDQFKADRRPRGWRQDIPDEIPGVQFALWS